MISATACRRRLHILYLLNDLLHHIKYHSHDSSQFPTFNGAIQPFVVDLIQLAAIENRPKVRTRIDDLLQIWHREAYFNKEYVDKLRETVSNSAISATENPLLIQAALAGQITDAKEQPYVMPRTHGDPSMPYHDLPAGNIMPHIMPNRTVPIRPDDVRALQFVAGPADENLVIAVKDFMTAVEEIDNGALDVQSVEGIVDDIDELGQRSLRDETGELVAGRTYYGWSREFCDKMKSRDEGKDVRTGRQRSYSSSRSRSRSPRKRRRYSHSTSNRSASSSRSSSRERQPYSNFRNSRQGNSPSERGRQKNRSRTRPSAYSPSFQPIVDKTDAPTSAGSVPSYQMPSQDPRPPYTIPQGVASPSSVSYANTGFGPHGFPPPPMGLGGLPIPPPPANYSGPWPPPPPPLPSGMVFGSAPGTEQNQVPQGYLRQLSHQAGQQHRGGSGSDRWR